MESNRIKKILRQRGVTYEQLAEKIGITPQAVGQIVNGVTTGATARFALASALGMTVAELWPPEQNAPALRTA